MFLRFGKIGKSSAAKTSKLQKFEISMWLSFPWPLFPQSWLNFLATLDMAPSLSLRPFVLSSLHLFIPSSPRPFIPSSLHAFVSSSFRPFIPSSLRLFVSSCLRPFAPFQKQINFAGPAECAARSAALPKGVQGVLNKNELI